MCMVRLENREAETDLKKNKSNLHYLKDKKRLGMMIRQGDIQKKL